ncbi:AbrB/MazE/SpoVT family DNA-binding domain-containing protein [Nocardia sp. NPDC058518]|uniref:AbrB/MazE/SpoVT family DNA-binding domain-containing protein n=1 Tax=Nocardia sp. NPDC058518 TaxID=3346534 RepID=UPI003662DCF6
MTSNGRVTIPLAVRDALGLHAGDDVHFRVEGEVETTQRFKLGRVSFRAAGRPLSTQKAYSTR